MSKNTVDPASLTKSDLIKVVRYFTGEHPEDIPGRLGGSAEVLEWLGDLFVLIRDSISTGETERAQRLTKLGSHLAEGHGNLVDCMREAMREKVINTIGREGFRDE
jgi:hypothetical protein